MRWSMRSIMNPQSGPPHFIQPRSPDAWNVATSGQRARMSVVRQIVGVIGSWRCSTSNRSRSSARTTRRVRAGREDDVRQRPVRGDDHRSSHGYDVGRRVAVTPDARVQDASELTRRVVAHDQAHVVATVLECCRLQLRVLDDRAPERPRERDDDPDLHLREPNDPSVRWVRCGRSTASTTSRASRPTRRGTSTSTRGFSACGS